MKAAILYATSDRRAHEKCEGLYTPTYVPGYGYVFIRAELVDCDVLTALDRVKSREGEIFLNSIPLDSEKAKLQLVKA